MKKINIWFYFLFVFATSLSYAEQTPVAADSSDYNQTAQTYLQQVDQSMASALSKSTPSNQIGLLLPAAGPLGYADQAVQSGIMAAYYRTSPTSSAGTIKLYEDGPTAIQNYQELVKGGAASGIGPLSKTDVGNFATMPLSVPILALNFTSTKPNSSNLYQFALSPEDEAAQVADKAWQDGHTAALIIAPDTEWGKNVAQAFQQNWQGKGGTIAGTFYFSRQASLDPGIKQLLQVMPGKTDTDPLIHRQDANMIFLLADPITARQVKPLLRFYYADDIPVYATSMIYTGKPNAVADNDLNGITFCDIPFVLENTANVQQAKQALNQFIPHATASSYRLFAFGYDAYNLLPLLKTLSPQSDQGYAGLTGILYMSNDQQIKRKLSWAVFHNGVPQPIG